jgi:diguanylate cyclase (GGDEF)-like protein
MENLMVKLLSVPMISTGFVSAFFFILYLYLGLKTNSSEKQHESYLLFSVLSLINTVYTISFAVLMNSDGNLDVLNIANRITIISSMFLIVLTFHFLKHYFDLPGRKDLNAFYFLNMIFSIFCVIDTPLFLTKQFHATSRYYTGLEFGPIFQIWGGYVILVMFYGTIGLYRGYILYARKNKDKRLSLLLQALTFMTWYAFGVCDALTGISIIDLPPLTWIGSLLMLLCIEIMLVLTIENLNNRISSLYRQVIHDTTTQVYTKGFFVVELDRRLQGGNEEDCGQFLIFADIDDFKSINDVHGHLCGDEVLKRIASIMKANLRQPDLIARYGGDEFIILMTHDGGIELTTRIIERIRCKVADEQFRGPESTFTVTCSFGIVAFDRDAPKISSREEVITKADAALYESKQRGKNRVYTLALQCEADEPVDDASA